ncbi:Uncharacterised protein [Mycobacteroides abscessus subsp. abscessus]|nr:Uncharacterised protein [Mycobacteroides abscessus subsp. abscessus]
MPVADEVGDVDIEGAGDLLQARDRSRLPAALLEFAHQIDAHPGQVRQLTLGERLPPETSDAHADR